MRVENKLETAQRIRDEIEVETGLEMSVEWLCGFRIRDQNIIAGLVRWSWKAGIASESHSEASPSDSQNGKLRD